MTRTWTKLTKASGTSWHKLAKPTSTNAVVSGGGSPIGLLLALTYTGTSSGVSTWTKITKASGTSWTKLTKAV